MPISLSRRDFLGGTLGAMASTALAERPLSGVGPLSATDDHFLEEIERTTFQYFRECSHPSTGLVKDRNHAAGQDDRIVASIAATGFGLTALCIAEKRAWLSHAEVREGVHTTLRFFAEQMPQERGFFYHFIDWRNGERHWNCELSSIDTALLLGGVLTCRAYFQRDKDIRGLATKICDRVDWSWMLNGGDMLAHGWMPEKGFLKNRWSKYCELMILYLLAIGANNHAIPPKCWDAWSRPTINYKGMEFISDGAPLFVHQYSHAWFDFRGRRDRYANYFENSIIATRAHRQFCIDLQKEFPNYNENLWGITASDSAKGYVAWGGPPRHSPIDGTLVPCAAGGSLPFLPRECIDCLHALRERFGSKVWTRYGFIDAYNPQTGWVADDVIGLDAGITLLMAENLRTGFVWRTFMDNPEARRGMQRAKFHRV